MCGVRAEVLRAVDVPDFNPNKISAGRREVKAEGEGDTDMREGEEGGEENKDEQEEEDQMARLGLLVPNIELATGCSPAHLPGGPPSMLAQTLTFRILRLLHSTRMLGWAPLKIWFRPPKEADDSDDDDDEGNDDDDDNEEREEVILKAQVKAFWVLYIDILFISLDGNAFDAAWLAMTAALRDTLLPRAWWDPDREMVLCSDKLYEGRKLEIRDMIVPLSFGSFESDSDDGGGSGGQVVEEKKKGKGKGKWKWVLVDMDGFEEALCREQGTVVVGDKGRVVRMEKNGGAGVGMSEMKWLVELAAKRREEWMQVLGMS